MSGRRTPAQNLRLFAPIAALHGTLYLLLNHFPPAASRTLPTTWLDEALPFLPWTTWPYLALIGPVPATVLLLREDDTVRRALRAYVVAFGLALPFYVLLPTHYPRPPLPEGDGAGALLYRLLVSWDTPECAFPSGHVIVPGLSAWAACREGRRFGPALAVFVILASPSILTTKQHYAWDLAAGALLTAIGVVVSRWPIERPLRRVVRRFRERA